MSVLRTAARNNRRRHLGLYGLLRSTATRRGVRGNSRIWLWVSVLLWIGSTTRRFFGKQPEILSTEVLKRGQAVTVQSIGPLSKRERAAIRKAG
jgi:hypothetical protein